MLTTALTGVDFNDGTGINTGTAVIADPEGADWTVRPRRGR